MTIDSHFRVNSLSNRRAVVFFAVCSACIGCSSKPPQQGSFPATGAGQSAAMTAGVAAPAPSAGTTAVAAGTMSQPPVTPPRDASTATAGTGAAGTGAAGTGQADASDDSDGGPMPDASTSNMPDAAVADAGPNMVADYTKPGPYTVKRLLNQAPGTISGGTRASIPAGHDNDPSAFTLYFPENAKPGDKFPLLTWGNGTFCSPTFYDVLIGHVVSYGFVVIATNTSSTGSAMEMLKGVEWALAQNDQSGSPIFGLVDKDKIGAFGHSQGGAGTCRAGADARIKAIAPLSGPSNAAAIKCPVFFVTTGGEAMSSNSVETAFNTVTTKAVYGVTMSGNHDEYTDVEDDPMVSGLTSNDAKQSRAAIVAWFEWQLKAKDEVKPLFSGANCGFCTGSTWKTIKSKGFE